MAAKLKAKQDRALSHHSRVLNKPIAGKGHHRKTRGAKSKSSKPRSKSTASASQSLSQLRVAGEQYMSLLCQELDVQEIDPNVEWVEIVSENPKEGTTNGDGDMETQCTPDCCSVFCFPPHTPFKEQPWQNPSTRNSACSCHHSSCRAGSNSIYHWDYLPDEVILAVFNFLPKTSLVRCARVCRRWYHLAFDDSLWKRVDLLSRTFSQGVLGHILSRNPTVVRLSQAHLVGSLFNDSSNHDGSSNDDNDDEISDEVNSEPQESQIFQMTHLRPLPIVLLDLSQCQAQPKYLAQLLSHCNQLKNVSLEGCQLSEAVFRGLARSQARLQVLNLAMCSGLDCPGATALLANCHSLKELNIAWTGLSSAVLKDLIDSLPRSTLKLNISGFRHQLTDQDVAIIAASCCNLVDLNLSDCSLITVASVVTILEGLPLLRRLALTRCFKLNYHHLHLLCSHPTLTFLNVFGFLSGDNFKELEETFPTITFNRDLFSSIARPCSSRKQHPGTIWGQLCEPNNLDILD